MNIREIGTDAQNYGYNDTPYDGVVVTSNAHKDYAFIVCAPPFHLHHPANIQSAKIIVQPSKMAVRNWSPRFHPDDFTEYRTEFLNLGKTQDAFLQALFHHDLVDVLKYFFESVPRVSEYFLFDSDLQHRNEKSPPAYRLTPASFFNKKYRLFYATAYFEYFDREQKRFKSSPGTMEIGLLEPRKTGKLVPAPAPGKVDQIPEEIIYYLYHLRFNPKYDTAVREAIKPFPEIVRSVAQLQGSPAKPSSLQRHTPDPKPKLDDLATGNSQFNTRIACRIRTNPDNSVTFSYYFDSLLFKELTVFPLVALAESSSEQLIKYMREDNRKNAIGNTWYAKGGLKKPRIFEYIPYALEQ